MQEKGNILRILKETKESVKKGDFYALKRISNHTINTASFTQDPDNIAVAVIVYSLSKILGREQYREAKGWSEFYKGFMARVDNVIRNIESNNDKKVSQDLELIRASIGKLSGQLKFYIQDVFRKASINKASRIYEHGISMEKTARLLGLTMYEVAGYAGQVPFSNAPLSETMDERSRIKLAMEMFK